MTRLRTPDTRDRPTSPAAFTLVELLVVLATIALLLAIMLPTLGGAREEARRARCLNHVRQWAMAMVVHAYDHNNWFMIEDDGPAGTDWMARLEGYTIDNHARLCPTASSRARTYHSFGSYGGTFERWDLTLGTGAETSYGSYAINSWLHHLPEGAVGWREGQVAESRHFYYQHLDHIDKVNSNVPMFADAAWFNSNPFDRRYPHNMGWVNPTPTWNEDNQRNPQWFFDMGRYQMKRHHDAVNMSFLDGSARTIDLEKLWSFDWHKAFYTEDHVDIPWLD